MKMQAGSATIRQWMLSLRKIPVVRSMAIALMLSGCNTSSQTTQSLKKTVSEAEVSTPLSKVSPAAKPKALNVQASTLATKNKSSADDHAAVQQAVLADPVLNASLQQAADRSPSSPVTPLGTGVIAIVGNYALAEVFGGVGDLPILDGYYLLVKQNGQWIGMDFVGGSEIVRNELVALDVPNDTINQLIDTLRAAGKKIWVDDNLYFANIPLPCTTQMNDPNPPTNVRLAPSVASGNVIGQLPNGAEVRVMQPLNSWLKIRQPMVGWVSMNLTRVSCGSSLAEVQKNLNALHLVEEQLSVKAADTLVRYIYRGADGASAETAIAHFNKFAFNRFYALEAALDQHSEEVRRQVVRQVISSGMSSQARESFERAMKQRETLSPTLKTWQALNQN
jgi:hypothetical protein